MSLENFDNKRLSEIKEFAQCVTLSCDGTKSLLKDLSAVAVILIGEEINKREEFNERNRFISARLGSANMANIK